MIGEYTEVTLKGQRLVSAHTTMYWVSSCIFSGQINTITILACLLLAAPSVPFLERARPSHTVYLALAANPTQRHATRPPPSTVRPPPEGPVVDGGGWGGGNAPTVCGTKAHVVVN